MPDHPATSTAVVDRPEAEALARLIVAVRDTGYAFTTVTPRSHGIVNARPGNEEARSLRDVFGWSRPFRAELLPAPLFEMLSASALIEDAGGGRHKSKVRLSTLHGRLFLHSAFPTEAVDSIFFGPGTYMFVDAVVDSLARRHAPVRRAVDICAGAGPGAITVAALAPEADVTLVDINPTALLYGAASAKAAGQPVRCCLGDKLADVDGDFDLIITHPPYLVDRASRAYRHGGGAFGSELSLEIVRAALDRLAPLGTLVVFTGIAIVDGEDAFKAKVCRWAAQAGCDWSYREVDPDVFGEELAQPAYAEVDRIAHVVFEATRRSGAS